MSDYQTLRRALEIAAELLERNGIVRPEIEQALAVPRTPERPAVTRRVRPEFYAEDETALERREGPGDVGRALREQTRRLVPLACDVTDDEWASKLAREAPAAPPPAPAGETPHGPDDHGLGVSPVAMTWRGVALRVGEELATSGPEGYYDFTPLEWAEWALAALRAQPAPTDDTLRALAEEAASEWEHGWHNSSDDPREGEALRAIILAALQRAREGK